LTNPSAAAVPQANVRDVLIVGAGFAGL